MVLAAAYSHELPRYGLEVGLTNYAAGMKTSSFQLLFIVLDVDFCSQKQRLANLFKAEGKKLSMS